MGELKFHLSRDTFGRDCSGASTALIMLLFTLFTWFVSVLPSAGLTFCGVVVADLFNARSESSSDSSLSIFSINCLN